MSTNNDRRRTYGYGEPYSPFEHKEGAYLIGGYFSEDGINVVSTSTTNAYGISSDVNPPFAKSSDGNISLLQYTNNYVSLATTYYKDGAYVPITVDMFRNRGYPYFKKQIRYYTYGENIKYSRFINPLVNDDILIFDNGYGTAAYLHIYSNGKEIDFTGNGDTYYYIDWQVSHVAYNLYKGSRFELILNVNSNHFRYITFNTSTYAVTENAFYIFINNEQISTYSGEYSTLGFNDDYIVMRINNTNPVKYFTVRRSTYISGSYYGSEIETEFSSLGRFIGNNDLYWGRVSSDTIKVLKLSNGVLNEIAQIDQCKLIWDEWWYPGFTEGYRSYVNGYIYYTNTDSKLMRFDLVTKTSEAINSSKSSYPTYAIVFFPN